MERRNHPAMVYWLETDTSPTAGIRKARGRNDSCSFNFYCWLALFAGPLASFSQMICTEEVCGFPYNFIKTYELSEERTDSENQVLLLLFS